ncbi:MAG: methyltransferase domain-containing protein [Planctomycetota bacterium]
MISPASDRPRPPADWNYFMDHADEARRLAAKVDAPGWVERELRGELAGAGGAPRVLDLGCGPGVLAAAAARAWPRAHVTGLDLSRRRLLHEPGRGLAFVQGRAEALPFADNTFDVVWCRFLLQYLPDKRAALREMHRVLCPRGMVLLQDLDGQLVWQHPMPAALRGELDVVLEHLAASGFDPHVGRKLFTMCQDAGLVAPEVRIEPYHVLAGSVTESERDAWQAKLRIAQAAVAAAFAGDATRAAAFCAAFERNLFAAQTLVYSVLFTVRARKRG